MNKFSMPTQYFIFFIFLSECFAGAWILIHKKMGYNHMKHVAYETTQIQLQIEHMKKEMQKVHAKLEDIKMYTYFQEKNIRERLHHCKKDEIIFFY